MIFGIFELNLQHQLNNTILLFSLLIVQNFNNNNDSVTKIQLLYSLNNIMQKPT